MSPLVGPFAAAAVLLVAGGAMKVVAPSDTAVALRAAGLPASIPLVRAASLLEAVLGAAALVTAWPILLAGVAASYLLFAAFVAWALVRRLPLSSCGCLGSVDTPPTPLHVVLNLAAAGVAVAAAAVGVPPVDEVLAHQPLAGIPFVATVGVTVWLAIVAMTDLPRALSQGRLR